MECSQVRAILFENTDTELPSEFRADVDEHLAVCRSCATLFQALREQSHVLENLPKLEAPRDFLQKVRSRVDRPSIVSRLKHGLSVFFAGKRFFQLAGAAAAAALVLITAQVALKDYGSQKALHSPAPPPAVSPPAVVPPPPPVGEPRALPASPQSLPDMTDGMSQKSFKKAPSPALESRPQAPADVQSLAITVRSPAPSSREKNRGFPFKSDKSEGLSASGTFAAGSRAPDQSRLKFDVSRGSAGPPGAYEGSPPPEGRKISSDVIRLIERAKGKLLSAAPGRDEHQPGTLLAEMPAANYPSFLDQLRQLGDVEFNGSKELSAAPDAKVRVSVSFDTFQ